MLHEQEKIDEATKEAKTRVIAEAEAYLEDRKIEQKNAKVDDKIFEDYKQDLLLISSNVKTASVALSFPENTVPMEMQVTMKSLAEYAHAVSVQVLGIKSTIDKFLARAQEIPVCNTFELISLTDEVKYMNKLLTKTATDSDKTAYNTMKNITLFFYRSSRKKKL